MEDNQFTSSAFAPHMVAPEKKRQKDYGLMNAKAIWYHNESTAPSMFYDDRDTYVGFMKYAFGQQDSSKYKPSLGINAKNQQQSFVGGIRWQNKNFATKRVQATVSKIFNRQYDPVATAIDPVSSNRREDMKAQLKTWMTEQQWLLERSQMLGMDVMPEGVDMSALPINDEDLNMFIETDMKLANEISTELGIQYHCDRLDWTDLKEKIDQYLTILPVAGVWCGLDASGMPTVKVLNPGRVLSPRSEFNSFKRIAYCGYVDDYTVAEFKRLAGNEFSEDELKRIISDYSNKGNYLATRYNTEYPETDRDIDTIQIMHFEVPTVDEYVFLQKKDRWGNDNFKEMPFNYYRGQEQSFRKKYRSERSLYRMPKATVYGGYWIVGSDIVFGYGEKNYCNGEIGYKLRASNMLNGYTTCLLKQMIPCLDNLETYDKKIQQVVASAIPRGIKIDLFALRKAQFEMNGKILGVGELVEAFLQSGILVTDSSESGPGDARKPLEVFDIGMSKDLVNYLALMKDELAQLDEIIGFNRVSSGADVSPEKGKAIAQMENMATDVNLDHLFRADRYLTKEVYKALGHLHRISVQLNPDFYIPIFGEESVSRIIAGVAFDEIGIDIEAIPTAQEWAEFYIDIDSLSKTGLLQPEDKTALRRFRSLKQAQAYLRVLSRKRQQQKQQEQLMLIDKNAEAQQSSNAQAAQQNMMVEQMKQQTIALEKDLDARNNRELHNQKMQQIQLQVTLMNSGKVEESVVDGEYALKVAKEKPSPKAPK